MIISGEDDEEDDDVPDEALRPQQQQQHSAAVSTAAQAQYSRPQQQPSFPAVPSSLSLAAGAVSAPSAASTSLRSSPPSINTTFASPFFPAGVPSGSPRLGAAAAGAHAAAVTSTASSSPRIAVASLLPPKAKTLRPPASSAAPPAAASPLLRRLRPLSTSAATSLHKLAQHSLNVFAANLQAHHAAFTGSLREAHDVAANMRLSCEAVRELLLSLGTAQLALRPVRLQVDRDGEDEEEAALEAAGEAEELQRMHRSLGGDRDEGEEQQAVGGEERLP